MFDVVSVGSNVVDTFVCTNVHEKGKVMSYPVGSKLLIKDIKYDVGGGGTNTAVAFSRLGLKTGYVGKTGKDVNGKRILDMLNEEKIKFLGKIEGQTDASIILDSMEHCRTILTCKNLNDTLKFNEVKKFKTKWMYYSSMMKDSLKTQVKLLENYKGKLAFNPSEYLIKEYNLNSILKKTNILILNKEEASLLTKNKDLLKGLYELGPEIVVVTDKNKDVKVYDGDKIFRIKPHNVKVKERTGAGDAFASTFVAGMIKGLTIDKSLKLALKNSESVIKYFGAKNKLLKMKL